MKREKITISPYVFAGIKLRDLPDEIRHKIKQRNKSYSHSIIVEAIEKVTDMKFADIIKNKRSVTLVDMRRIYCYQVRDKLRWSLKEIGESIGGKDHTTVIHNLKTYANIYETGDDFRNMANRVADEIEFSSEEYLFNKFNK